jgi:hypothetical protein
MVGDLSAASWEVPNSTGTAGTLIAALLPGVTAPAAEYKYSARSSRHCRWSPDPLMM